MSLTHKFCVAPMMDRTDRHDRYFLRLISRHARLYTEMLTADAVRFGDRDRLLGFDAAEHPLALQLGGNHPQKLAEAAAIAADYGYDEINLNVGCPSDRVQSGQFGACLMRTPALVADCVAAMRHAVDIPITVKCRIGVDDQNPQIALPDLITQTAQAGCQVFIIHARKAWLKGLNPKQNRDIPPLDYPLVYQMKQNFPELTIVLNGGITNLSQAGEHLAHIDGVMLGRAVYKTPYLLAEVDRLFFDSKTSPLRREEVVEALLPYAAELVRRGYGLHALTRHLPGLFQGQPGGRKWRRFLSEQAVRPHANAEILQQALAVMTEKYRPDISPNHVVASVSASASAPPPSSTALPSTPMRLS